MKHIKRALLSILVTLAAMADAQEFKALTGTVTTNNSYYILVDDNEETTAIFWKITNESRGKRFIPVLGKKVDVFGKATKHEIDGKTIYQFVGTKHIREVTE